MQTAASVPCWIGSKKLEAFLKDVSTPLFLYNEKSFAQAAQALFAPFSWNCGFALQFPVRMNPNPAILRCLQAAGCGALCRNGQELKLAAQCGFQAEHIFYEPSCADPEAETAAHALGAVFVLDDLHVLPARPPQTAVVLLRQQGPLRFDDRTVTGVPLSNAGMERQALLRLADSLHTHGTKTIGLGMRLGDLCMDQNFYPAVFAQLAALAEELLAKTGIAAALLDLGGGFGVSYRPGFDAPRPEICADVIRARVRRLPEALRSVRLAMSPGRFLAAAGGILISRVQHVKPGTPPVAILDLAPAQCLRLTRNGAYHPVSALRTAGRAVQCQLLSGRTQDGPAVRQVLPALRPGDPVVIGMLGADGHSFSSGYGAETPCPEYLLRANGRIESITAY